MKLHLNSLGSLKPADVNSLMNFSSFSKPFNIGTVNTYVKLYNPQIVFHPMAQILKRKTRFGQFQVYYSKYSLKFICKKIQKENNMHMR